MFMPIEWTNFVHCSFQYRNGKATFIISANNTLISRGGLVNYVVRKVVNSLQIKYGSGKGLERAWVFSRPNPSTELPGTVTMEIRLTAQHLHGSTPCFQSERVCIGQNSMVVQYIQQ
jgi:hypothetical protein